ncbi:unnamed protein product [Prorocentrum cordatum]|uniref:Integrase catalytic domain-containing protein n=1 Tax=Prorocentrum cordatum TaxID=2364126 RepID=A0ABN9R013_9DINO|nr:unnamed protein product [Polarella glacialis]
MVANDKRYKDFFEKLDDKTSDQLDDATNAATSVDDVDWEDLSTQLYCMLELAVPEYSAGETIMRNVLHGEGGQAWIRLKGEYAPNEPGNVVARLRQLMSTQFVTNADVANEIEKLDLETSKYEKAAEEQLSDDIKKGILLGAQRSFDGDSMEIGALTGKPKGTGNGKGDKDEDNDHATNKFEPEAKDSPNHPRKWCSLFEKPNHVKDDRRKFKRENEAMADAKKKANDGQKQRRAMGAALAAGGGTLPGGLPPPPGCDGAGQHSQRLTRRAVHGEPQLPAPTSSGAAWRASTTPTVPSGMRGASGFIAEQGTIKPKYRFALSAEHSRPRARSAEPSGSRRSAGGDSVCVSGIRGVKGVAIDSGAQIAARPFDVLKYKGYVLAKSGIPKLRAIDGAEAQHCASANKMKLGADRGTCYLEYDEMMGGSSGGKRAARMASIGGLGESIGGLGEFIGEQLGEELCLNATRETLRAQGPATEARRQLPTALGPDPSENATLKAKALARPGQPSGEVSTQPKGDDEYPVVEMDFFLVATDEIARKYPMVNGYVVKVDDFRKLEHKGRGGLPATLDVVDCRSNAPGSLFGSKHMGDYKSHFVAKLIDSLGRATVILLADGENAIVALAGQVEKLRSHSTIARQGPAYSSKSTGHIEASNGAAAGLLRALRFSLETKLGCKLELSDSVLAFLANTVGWYTARFQPRSHGGSSCRYLFGRECAGEVAEVGEQVWHRIAARVAAGWGKFAARLAKGIWVGKSEFDDQRLVVDLQRGFSKARSVRRMPEELRWNAGLAKQIDVAPWAPVPERVRASIRKSTYITENMSNTYGPTDSCPKCTHGRGQHSEQCRQRSETIAQERLEAKLAEEARGGAAPGTPAAPGPAPQAPPRVPADARAAASSPAAAAPPTAPPPVAIASAYSAGPDFSGLRASCR